MNKAQGNPFNQTNASVFTSFLIFFYNKKFLFLGAFWAGKGPLCFAPVHHCYLYLFLLQWPLFALRRTSIVNKRFLPADILFAADHDERDVRTILVQLGLPLDKEKRRQRDERHPW